MVPTYQLTTVQAGGASAMVCAVYSCCDMGVLLMLLETTLRGDRYITILFDQLHPFMSSVHSDGLGQFKQGNVTPCTLKVATDM